MIWYASYKIIKPIVAFVVAHNVNKSSLTEIQMCDAAITTLLWLLNTQQCHKYHHIISCIHRTLLYSTLILHYLTQFHWFQRALLFCGSNENVTGQVFSVKVLCVTNMINIYLKLRPLCSASFPPSNESNSIAIATLF